MAKLGKVCDVRDGTHDSPRYVDNGYPLITSKNLSSGSIDFSDVNYISEDDYNKINQRSKVDIGDIIMPMIGTIGNPVIVDIEPCFSIKNVALIKFINNDIYNKYVYYILNSDCFIRYIEDKNRGGTQKFISLNDIREFEFPLPDYPKQQQIAANLDKVTHTIDLCNAILEKLDLLVKSRFVEMFGTLEAPASDFEYDTLKNLCSKITDGKHGGCTLKEDTSFYFVGAREIYDDAVHYETAPEITAEEFYKDYKRCNVEIGDFLIVNTGATIGKSAIAVDGRTEHTLLQKSVALLKVKKEVLSPIFLMYCYKINDRMYKVESASAQPNLLLSKINATKIYVPPLSLQEQFAAFVEQTDKSKSVVKQVLEKAETLKKALMQEYFG